jgi:hypothetical protein
MYLFKMFASDGNSTNTNSEFDDEVWKNFEMRFRNFLYFGNKLQ